ncbi:hypothetical protein BDW72DRAFT_185227 [Aspergillus terricola var. indicus]
MAAPPNQEPQSASSRTTKPIGHDKPTASDIPGQYGPFLDSLRITPQERSFLQDLLAPAQPQSMDAKELDVVERQHQDTSQKYNGPDHNDHSSTSREGAVALQEGQLPLGMLAEIADIQQAWESWHGSS